MYYHLSRTLLPIGTVLQPRFSPNFGEELEGLLEQHRPACLLPRPQTVYMSGEPVFRGYGLVGGFANRVEPLSPVSRHDVNWLGRLQVSYGAQHFGMALMRAWVSPWTDASIAELCTNYWTGIADKDPLWEYTTSGATIVEHLGGGYVSV